VRNPAGDLVATLRASAADSSTLLSEFDLPPGSSTLRFELDGASPLEMAVDIQSCVTTSVWLPDGRVTQRSDTYEPR
jgi:hypothetical protein